MSPLLTLPAASGVSWDLGPSSPFAHFATTFPDFLARICIEFFATLTEKPSTVVGAAGTGGDAAEHCNCYAARVSLPQDLPELMDGAGIPAAAGDAVLPVLVCCCVVGVGVVAVGAVVVVVVVVVAVVVVGGGVVVVGGVGVGVGVVVVVVCCCCCCKINKIVKLVKT